MSASFFQMFIDGFHPESGKMVMAYPPHDDGLIPRVYISLKGLHIQGMRVAEAELSAYNLRMTPPEQWKELKRPQVLGFLECNARAVVNEQDVKDFLSGRTFNHGRWKDGTVDFFPDYVDMSFRLKVDLKLFHTTFKMNAQTAFDVKQGSQLWLDVKSFSVNDRSVPLSTVNQMIRGVQPILDLKKFGLPLKLAHIKVTDEQATVETLRLPRQFDGPTWTWNGKAVSRTK